MYILVSLVYCLGKPARFPRCVFCLLGLAFAKAVSPGRMIHLQV